MKILGVILIPIMLYLLLDRTPFLKVKELYITDYNATEIEFIDKASLEAQLKDYALDLNIFTVDTDRLKAILLKSDRSQFIDKIYISKLFPNSIKVELTERKPFISVDSPKFCATLDKSSYVLNVKEIDEPVVLKEGQKYSGGNCDAELIKYQTIHVIAESSKLEFVLGSLDQAIPLEKIKRTLKVIDASKYLVDTIYLNSLSMEFNLENKSVIRFSLIQDIDIQLKRLILVVKEMEIQKIDFKTMDLRYSRPAITK